jgi:hypothetical protein
MADDQSEKIDQGKLDLVPMIDCILLLLLFFILTTRFDKPDEAIASMLPTEQGTVAQQSATPPERANICIYPAGLERGLQPSEYASHLRELGVPRRAWLRVGAAEPLEIDVAALRVVEGEPGSKAAVDRQLSLIHGYIAGQLARFEGDGPRVKQCPISIHCFSGMPWAFALIAYDACRGYEAGHGAVASYEFGDKREVDFGAPRLRDATTHALGDELYEIIGMR